MSDRAQPMEESSPGREVGRRTVPRDGDVEADATHQGSPHEPTTAGWVAAGVGLASFVVHLGAIGVALLGRATPSRWPFLAVSAGLLVVGLAGYAFAWMVRDR